MAKKKPSTKPFIDPYNDPVSPEQEKVVVNIHKSSQRIEMVREERNMSRSAFAKSIGMTPQGYQSMIQGNYLQGTVALAIEYRHGFNSEWLITGEGEIKVDVWEKIRGEVEDSFLRDLDIFISQKLKRTRPMIYNKDNNAKQYRK